MADFKILTGTSVNAMTTELNSLANGSGALGAEWDNSAGLWPFVHASLNVTFGSNPTASSVCEFYLVPALDGTNYAYNATGASPFVASGFLLGVFVLNATTSIQRVNLSPIGPLSQIQLPGYKLKGFLVNRSGVAFPASGSTVVLYPQSWKTV